jgi:1-acyl-sn-glycerol-3-phosphate acyltransferase
MIRVIARVFQILYCIYAFVLFVAILFLISPGILIALMMQQPASGNLTIRLSKFWSDAWLFLIGIRHVNIEKEPIETNQHYVFVANHISYLDIPLIFQAIRHNMIRVLGKAEMSRIPVFGTLYKLAVILVDRSSAEKRAKSVLVLKKMLAKNVSIFIFPEGTFNETGFPLKSFYDGAFRVAIETQTAIKPIVFLDANHLMHYSSVWKFRPGLSRAVILPAVPVNGFTLADVDILKKQVYELMESTIIEYSKSNASPN